VNDGPKLAYLWEQIAPVINSFPFMGGFALLLSGKWYLWGVFWAWQAGLTVE
jgi:hypothetical protein